MNSTAVAHSPLVFKNVTKKYSGHVALDAVNFELPPGHVVGLLGRNGAGKTTLLQIAAGIVLPTTGTCDTLGVNSGQLDGPELTRLGLVQQEGKFIEWMTGAQHLEFNASFYPDWDCDLQSRLTEILEVPLNKKISHLSTGDRQKIGILLGVCHRPNLLLLDEPMSSLDPIARTRMLDVLLERLRDDGCTVLISSHILNDVEKIVDWIVALDSGRVVENTSLDTLQESFSEWTVTAEAHALPVSFNESYILSCEQGERMARLIVRTQDPEALAAFTKKHGVQVHARALGLEDIFPLLVAKPGSSR